jgi:hypothetical protein
MKAGSMRRALAVVALVGAIGACSGGGGDRATQEGGASDIPGGEVAIDYSLDHGTEDSVVPGSDELEAVLLAEDDLPDGLVDLRLGYSAVEACGLRTELPESTDEDQYPTGAAAFAFDDEPIVPDVFQKIVVAPSGTGAEVFQRARGHLDRNCYSGAEIDGLAFLGARDLAAPSLGDETVAKRVTIEHVDSATTIEVTILYARDGDTIVIVGMEGPELETDRFMELASLAFDRATAG